MSLRANVTSLLAVYSVALSLRGSSTMTRYDDSAKEVSRHQEN